MELGYRGFFSKLLMRVFPVYVVLPLLAPEHFLKLMTHTTLAAPLKYGSLALSTDFAIPRQRWEFSRRDQEARPNRFLDRHHLE